MPPEILSVKPRQDLPDAPPPPKPTRNNRFRLPLAIGSLLLLAAFGSVVALALKEQKPPPRQPVTNADTAKLAQVPAPTTTPTQLTVTQLSAQNSELINLLAKALQVSNNLAVQGNVTVGGSLTASALSGSGAGLTGVNAALLGGEPGSYYSNLAGTSKQAVTQLQASAALLAAPNIFTANNKFLANLTIQGAATASSLSLGTALPVPSGGTGLSNVPAASVLFGQGGPSLGVATPASAGLCLLSGATTVTWGPCISGTSDVTSLDGLTGALTVANSSAAAGLITINAAKADGTTLGLATFNTTNFTDNGAGVIDTIQDLATTSAPTFSQLTLSSNSLTALTVEQAGVHNNVLTVDTTNGSVGINQAPNPNNALTVTGTAGFTGTVQAPNFTLTDGTNVNGFLKNYSIGTGGVSAHDAVVLANDGGTSRVMDTATNHDPRVMGVALSAGATGAIVSIAIAGNASVMADTGAVAIGDQLVTSATAGQVTADNTATTGILGLATSAKAAGSSGLVGVYVRPVGGTTNPNIPGNLTVQGTTTTNTITPTAAFTLGATGQQFTLQGTGASTITGTGGGFTTTIGFSGSPTANQTFNFDRSAAAGTYTVCTTAGNCGNGVTATGTTNKIAKFTGPATLGDSSIADTGSSVSITPTTNSTTTFQIQNATGTSTIMNVDSTNLRVGIGTLGTPTGQLYVSGSVPSAKLGSIAEGGFGGDVYVQGRYAYTTDATNDKLHIVDVSNPANPTDISSLTLTGAPQKVFVQGHFAYVTTQGADALDIINISNPSNPVQTGTISNGISAPFGVYAEGRYAYVSNQPSGTNTITVYDVSNPANPVKIGTANTDGGLANAQSGSFVVNGRYLYILNNSDGAGKGLEVFDISNPTNPTSVGSHSTGTTPRGIYVQGRYAYVANFGASSLTIFDISNPASIPAAVGTVALHTQPQDIYVQGRYAYVANNGDSAHGLEIVDVSNPSSPSSAGSVATDDEPFAVFVSGRYGYIMARGGTAVLDSFDLGGTYDQQLQAGGVEAGTLQVRNNTDIGGAISVQGGVTVGQAAQINGDFGVSGSAVFANATNSATAFQIQNATGTTQFSVDTSLSVVHSFDTTKIGNTTTTTAPTFEYLSDISNNAAGNALLTGNWVSSNNWGIGPSSNAADHTLRLGVTNANFGSDWSNAINLNLLVTGTETVRPTTGNDSTTAFSVQNASSNPIFTVDTANNGVGINQAPVTGVSLSVSGSAQADNLVVSGGDTSSGILKNYTTGTGGVSAGDVVVLADDGGTSRVIDTTTAHDPRVMGVASATAASGLTEPVVIGGNTQVTADAGAVAIGDQLVTSTTSGQVTVDNNATTGILGLATTAKAAGSSGLVGVYVHPDNGTTNPTINGNLAILNSSKIYLNTPTDGAWTIGREASPSGTNLLTTAATVFTVQNTSTEGVMIRNAAGQSVFEVTGLGQTLIKTPTNSASAFQIQNNLGASVLTADTSSMTVTVQKLVITADLTVNGHLISGGSTPGIAAGPAACTSPTVSVSGNDTAGTITVTTGTGCGATGKLATITFAGAFGSTPRVNLTPAGATAVALAAYVDNATVSTSTFDLDSTASASNTTTYIWNYLVVQ